LSDVSKALIPLIVLPLGLIANYVLQRGMAAKFDYQCGKCGHRFRLGPLAGAIAPHRPVGRKWIRCPKCGSFSWASPVQRDGR
jgi:DNA-directed RNA polymerase subunit RPC12/RpoP